MVKGYRGLFRTIDSRFGSRRVFLFWVVLVISAAICLYAQTTNPASESYATTIASVKSENTAGKRPDPQKPYVIGFARLEDKGLPPAFRPFASALPLLIARYADPLPPRFEASEYSVATRQRELDIAVFKAGAELSARLDEIALKKLEPNVDPHQKRLALSEAINRKEKAEDSLNALLNGDSSNLSLSSRPTTKESAVTSEARTTRVWSGHISRELVEFTDKDPGKVAFSKSIDLLIWGTLAPVGDYVSLFIHGFDVHLGQEVFFWKEFADPNDPEPLAQVLADRIATWVAGAEFARVDISADPSSAWIEVDGKPLGSDAKRLYRFGKGRMVITGKAPGMQDAQIVLDLAPGDRKTARLTLDPSESSRILLDTIPIGAHISHRGIPLGTAPVEILTFGERSIASAESPGFESDSIILPAYGDSMVSLELHPEDGLGPSGRVGKAMDAFYEALGWFVLSLPPASLSLGAYSAYSESYKESEQKGNINTSLGASMSISAISLGLFASVSAGLAVNAIIRLVAYIGAAR